jgi:hypothetical protein
MGAGRARSIESGGALDAGLLGRLRLRYLTVAISAAGAAPFLLLAAVHPRAASVALAGAALVLAHGLFWLVVLRHNRLRLRRHGLRW